MNDKKHYFEGIYQGVYEDRRRQIEKRITRLNDAIADARDGIQKDLLTFRAHLDLAILELSDLSSDPKKSAEIRDRVLQIYDQLVEKTNTKILRVEQQQKTFKTSNESKKKDKIESDKVILAERDKLLREGAKPHKIVKAIMGKTGYGKNKVRAALKSG